jgi:hypothetical protein
VDGVLCKLKGKRGRKSAQLHIHPSSLYISVEAANYSAHIPKKNCGDWEKEMLFQKTS